MGKHTLLIATLLLASATASAQGIAINNDGSAPDTSALLDVKSTTKGLLVPRMTQAQRDAIVQPAAGLMLYQTDQDSGYYYRRGTGWYGMADNLGIHKMTQNLNTNGFTLSRDGSGNGMRPQLNGEVRFYGVRQTTTSTFETARLDADGGFLVRGELGYGNIPISGDGSRMMWYPFKSSFRAGRVDNGSGAWDDANNGFYSAAFGYNCAASGIYAFSAGGSNTVSSQAGTALGLNNAVSGTGGVALGSGNVVSDFTGVALGYGDTARGQGAVALGYLAVAGGDYSVALGNRATATGDYSIAIGQRSSTSTYQGAFIATDASTVSVATPSANNQFNARFASGYRLFTNATQTTGVVLAGGGSSWATVSDSTKKERFLATDGEAFLQKLRGMRVGSWNYKVQPESQFRHYGPMAQDFYAAFGRDAHGTIGNDTTIAAADMDGVLLILTKALEKRTTEQAAELADLKAENERLKAQLTAARQTGDEWAAFKTLLASEPSMKGLVEKMAALVADKQQSVATRP